MIENARDPVPACTRVVFSMSVVVNLRIIEKASSYQRGSKECRSKVQGEHMRLEMVG